ncbi:DNA topoisomerase 3-alpha [Asimina triloba]
MELSNNARRGTTRQPTCVHCSQRGHMSDDCPSQVSSSRGRQHSRSLNSENGGMMDLNSLFHSSLYVACHSQYDKCPGSRFYLFKFLLLICTTTNPTSDNAGRNPVVCGGCGTPCVLLTASTATNRGRKFYKCLSQACNFFVWADSVDTNSMGRGSGPQANSTTGRGGRSRGRRGAHTGQGTTFVTATGEPVSGQRCYSCGDPSHFANVCPNRHI